jgi:EmrB/QacA subfamily drug resistance transporter
MKTKRWLGIASLVPTVALVFIEQTILSVALPTIQQDLNTSYVALQWCVNAYLLTLTVFVLASGKLSDRMGHRNCLSLGMSIFAIASLLCGLSPNVALLIAGRALQGVGAAMMLPAQSTLVASIFPPENRGRATGLVVSIGAIFMVIAPLLGGYLTESLSWRWIFWVNLPVAAIGLTLIPRFLPNLEPGKQKIDLPGFLYFALAISSLTTLFMQANVWGWLSWKVLTCALLTLLGAVLLGFREKKISHPFLDLALFKKPKYAAINLSISITQFIVMITVFQTIYFQEVLQFTPFQTGLLQFGSCIPVLFMPLIAGHLSDKITPKLPIALGYLFMISAFLFLGFNSTPSLPSLVIVLILFGMGIPFIFTPSYSSAMSTIPPAKIGVGFGMLITLRMFSATMGLALTQLFVATVEENQLPKVGPYLAKIASFSWVHLTLAFLLIVAFALTFVLHNQKSEHHLPPSPAEGWD